MKIFEQLIAILDTFVPPSGEGAYTPETRIEDLGLDSLDRIEAIMALEENFAVSIDDAKAEKLETLGQVVELLKQLGVSDT